jgi:hypothetical protein
MVYEPSQSKRKTPPKIRHSARMQNKLSTGAKSKMPPASGLSFRGITTNIIDQFPFGQFTDSEVVSLFEKK